MDASAIASVGAVLASASALWITFRPRSMSRARAHTASSARQLRLPDESPTVTSGTGLHRNDLQLPISFGLHDPDDPDSMNAWDESVEHELPEGWVDAMDSLAPEQRARLARLLSHPDSIDAESAKMLLQLSDRGSDFRRHVTGEDDETRERNLPHGWIGAMDSLAPEERTRLARLLSRPVLIDAETLQRLRALMGGPAPADSAALLNLLNSLQAHIQSVRETATHHFRGLEMQSRFEARPPLDRPAEAARGFRYPTKGVPSKPAELLPAELAAVASTAASSIDHALALLFIRLGPPPEETPINFAPASTGGGGAQQ